MEYQEYIKLGFTRGDTNDSVEFKRTGYSGFYLEKKVNKRLSISVNAGELDRPKLYLKKYGQETCHIFNITGEMVRDLLYKKE